ncbi:hypothetical protein B0H10DRAFT_2441963 [Mycena sp. CBHHK59/15]|nr:hypothetical protein B0H10DRAFT_2441963 [Mycena sp. CBHHK59/15]
MNSMLVGGSIMYLKPAKPGQSADLRASSRATYSTECIFCRHTWRAPRTYTNRSATTRRPYTQRTRVHGSCAWPLCLSSLRLQKERSGLSQGPQLKKQTNSYLRGSWRPRQPANRRRYTVSCCGTRMTPKSSTPSAVHEPEPGLKLRGHAVRGKFLCAEEECPKPGNHDHLSWRELIQLGDRFHIQLDSEEDEAQCNMNALDIPGGITGHFMLLIMVLTYTTASQCVRDQCFEAFWHLAFFFLLGLYTHATGCFVRDSADPAYVRTFPFYSTAHCLRIQGAARDATVKGSCASERRDGAAHYKPSFKYTPGQWLFLRIPGILRFQWHPFMTSAPKDSYVSVHIRQVGDFTHALGERLGVGHAVVAEMTAAAMQGADVEKSSGFRGDYVELAASTALPGVSIDGPYGASAEDVFDDQVAILVGAGIDSISAGSCNRLTKPMYRRHALRVDPEGHMVPAEGRLKSLQRVEFFWICRDAPSFGWFQNLLAEVQAALADPNFLRISVHLTQMMSDDMIWNIALNDAGSDYAPLKLIRTLFGRPDWMAIYGRMRQAIESGECIAGGTSQLQTKVGTYFVGRAPSGRLSRRHCPSHRSASSFLLQR